MPKSKVSPTKGLACNGVGEAFKKTIINRNALGDNDVELEIKFCGISHQDVHALNNDAGTTTFPLIPGHEITGVVIEVGDNVERFEVGDTVAVGPLVESCGACTVCANDEQQYCPERTLTYDDVIKHGSVATNTGHTFGGYSKKITVPEKFLINIPDALPLQLAAPLLCAGASMYSALKHFGAGSGGIRVGIVGVGGLGHLGIKLAIAMGNDVTAISTTPSKENACKEMGCKQFILSTDQQVMQDGGNSLDLIFNTNSAPHQCSVYLPLLACSGTIVNLGSNLEPQNIDLQMVASNRLSVAGSTFAGLGEVQECVDFCTVKEIKPEIEIVAGEEKLKEIIDFLAIKNDTMKRYVLDIANTF